VPAWERSTVRLTPAAALGLGLADVLDQAKAREVLALVVIQPRDGGALTDAAANLQLRSSECAAAKYAAPHAIW
jgi:hypothetical protein